MEDMEQILEPSVSFRQRVQDFWQLFVEYESELLYRMHHEQDPSQGHLFMQKLLQNVFPRPVFQLHTYDDYEELIISPDGSGSRLYQLAYWRMQAPEEITARWEIVIGIPPIEAPERAVLDVSERRIYALQIQVWPVLLEDGRIGIEVYSEALRALGPEHGYMASCMLVEQCIGELRLMSNVAYVTLLEQPAMEPHILLPALGNYIENLKLSGQLPPQDDPLGLFSSYTMEPQEEQVYLRDDIYFGNVSAAALPILQEYYVGANDLFDDAAQEGVIWGFLFFTITDIDAEQRVNVRAAIEDALNQALIEHGVGECVGSASGYQYAYLDCICYDWAGFMDVAERVLESHVQLYQLSLTGFADFRKEGNMYVIQTYQVSPVDEPSC